MNEAGVQIFTVIIAGAGKKNYLINTPFTKLSMTFDYPSS